MSRPAGAPVTSPTVTSPSVTSPSVTSPTVEVTADLVASLVERGGYTHPLFRPTPAQQASGRSAPLPGQAVLLLAGGLVEQSGALDDAIALVELRAVRFLRMVSAGDVLRVVLAPGRGEPTRSGKLLREDRWTVVDASGEHVLEASAVMLVRGPDEGA